uniref:Cystatin domain-containing protein n=1 Tax=Leptobrachium leishanense TaxID=445787 RepID=A0A8C5MA72_9ANUR
MSQVFGQCKAILNINKLRKTQKLLRYNCTMSPVPSAELHRLCPDCPAMAKQIFPEDIALADQLVEIYNKENNYIRFFKTYHVERESLQWVFGPSVFLKVSIKETNCSKNQDNVNISNCDFLPDKDAKVGFCNGNTFRHPEKGEKSSVSCDLYKPRDRVAYHQGDSGCVHKKENNTQKGHPDVPAQNDEYYEKEGADAEMFCRCRPHIHHRHSCQPHHHHRPHHKPGKNHHHASSEQHGSSSEEQNGKKHHNCRPKGSVEMIFLEEKEILPDPIIVPDKRHPTEFPDSNSPLETCPGKPNRDIEMIEKYFPQEKERKH